MSLCSESRKFSRQNRDVLKDLRGQKSHECNTWKQCKRYFWQFLFIHCEYVKIWSCSNRIQHGAIPEKNHGISMCVNETCGNSRGQLKRGEISRGVEEKLMWTFHGSCFLTLEFPRSVRQFCSIFRGESLFSLEILEVKSQI